MNGWPRVSDFSYVQTNFQGGEVSPAFRGRADDKEYLQSLTLCLNYIPNMEGSLSPRSGFKRCGMTHFNSPARLIPFRLSSYEPYIAEFTASNPDVHFGYLQFWANGLPALNSDPYALLTNVAGDPPTFTFQDNRAGGGNGLDANHWADGDSVFLILTSIDDIKNYGHLANREWTLNVVSASAGTATLSDAETGDPLTGSITFANTVYMYRRLVLETFYNTVSGIRKVEYTAQSRIRYTPNDSGDYRSSPDHQVAFLHQGICPSYLSSSRSIEAGLIQADFLDGPYLDSPGTDIPLKPSGRKGEITISLHAYSTSIHYGDGDITLDSGTYFVSLTADNINNALPTTPSANANWAPLPIAWNSGTSYFVGQPATGNPTTNDGVPEIYYSKTAANLNNPLTDGTKWGTTPPSYAGGTTYAAGAHVISGGIQYVSIQAGNIGHTPASSPTFWLPVDLDAAVDTTKNNGTGWPSRAAFSFLDQPGHDDVDNSPGRLVRLKWGPQPWNTDFTYAADDLVNYKDNIYKSLAASNVGNIPDQDAENWEISAKTIQWTWAQVTSWTDRYNVTVEIRGDALPTSGIIWEFRLGLYCDSIGWPQVGGYHEGRLWFAGPMKNRIDAGVSNEGFNFSPTAPDGTVADNNAIGYVLNSKESQNIVSITSSEDGVILGTSERPWLIQASQLSDPITPTSIQAKPVGGPPSAETETESTENATLMIQNGRRRVLEFRHFVDSSSYQSRLNALDITRKCQHLTTDGVMQVAYQRVPQPVVWCGPRGISDTRIGAVCIAFPLNIVQTDVPSVTTLFGIGYCRSPLVSYEAPFSIEHGRTLADGVQQDICSIAVNRGSLDTAEYLYIATCGEDNNYHVEMLMPVADSEPLDDTFNDDGTIATYGARSKDFFLDSGAMPIGASMTSNVATTITFHGLNSLAGETVQFTLMGKYIGEYTVDASGDCDVAFNDAFDLDDVVNAIHDEPNSTILPVALGRLPGTDNVNTPEQEFHLGVSGDFDLADVSATGFYGQFGYKYRRRGQMLRPLFQGNTGPSFAKSRRNALMGVYVGTAQEISIGDSFDNLHPLTLTVSNQSVRPLTADDFVTGIFRDSVEDDYTYDGNLCWEQTRPVRGSILAVGGFLDYEEKA